MQRRRKGDIAIAVCAFAAVAVLVMLRASLREQRGSFPSTFDYGPNGYAAVYLFLRDEHVWTERFESPPSQLFSHRGTLVDAGDAYTMYFALSQRVSAYDTWVKSGNRIVLLGRAAPWSVSRLGIPACATGAAVTCKTKPGLRLVRFEGRTAAAIIRRGKGSIAVVPSVTVFDNGHLARGDHAAFAYAFFSGHGPVLFDETIYGYVEGKSFWQVLPFAARAAIVLAIAAVLLAVAGANLPFAPPQRRPDGGGRTTGEYIAAVAQLLERAGAGREVVEHFCKRAAGVLRPRARADERARALLERASELQAVFSPSPADVLAAGQLYAEVQKNYE